MIQLPIGSFLTAARDTEFEGQHFDRKEACRMDVSGNLRSGELNGMKGPIQECISAFSSFTTLPFGRACAVESHSVPPCVVHCKSSPAWRQFIGIERCHLDQ